MTPTSWHAIGVRFFSAWMYRVPDTAFLCSPVPGPSCIRLAIVGAARERARSPLGGGDEMAAARAAMDAVLPQHTALAVQLPSSLTLSTHTVRRLVYASGRHKDLHTFVGNRRPMEICIPGIVPESGKAWYNYLIWVRTDPVRWETIQELLPWLRRLGTDFSMCVAEQADLPVPSWSGCAIPAEMLEQLPSSGTRHIPLLLKDLPDTADPHGLLEDFWGPHTAGTSRRKDRSALRDSLWLLPIRAARTTDNGILFVRQDLREVLP